MGHHARKFLANYTILVAGDLASKILLLWASVRMAHVLGTGLFGDVAFAGAFTAYFSLLVSQGLGTYGTQEVARQPGRVAEYVGAILALRVSASLVAGLALAGIVWGLGKPAEIKVLLLLYGLMFFSSALTLSWVFQALEEMRLVAFACVLSQLAFSACILIFLKRPTQTALIPVFQFAGEALSALTLIAIYTRKFGAIRLLFDLRTWSLMWKESLPIGLSTVLGMVLYNFDIVLMGFMRSPGEVGLYGAAYKFINFFSAFLTLYNANLLPSVSRCRNAPAVLRRISDRSLKYTLLLTVPLAAGGTLVARPLMELIFGPQFSTGARALAILLWIIPIMASRAVYRASLLSHGFQRDYLWIALYAAVVNTGLNLILIPRYSLIGAAVASVTGELLVFILIYERVARRVVRLAFGLHVWRPVVACIPMVVLLLRYQDRALPLLVGGGFVIYAVSAWAVGAFKPQEIWAEIRASEPGLSLDSENPPGRY